MQIILIGPPGAGKGTQAKNLLAYLKVPHISTGELLRKNIAAGTKLGKLAEPIISKGNLVPDDVVQEMVSSRLSEPDCSQGCLFDGYPRTLAQADALDEMLAALGRKIDRAIELKVPDEVLSQRLLERAQKESDPRADDTMDTIPRRMAAYHSQTEPILGYYRSRNLLDTVKGVGSVDEVFQRITQIVDAIREQG